MIDHLLQCTLAGLIAIALSFCWRRASAALRYAALLAALLRFLIPTAWLTDAGMLVRHLSGVNPAFTLEESGLHVPRTAEIAIQSAAPPPVRTNLWSFWASGFLLSLGLWARRLRHKSECLRQPNPDELQALCDARRSLPARARIELRIVAGDQAPSVRGWWRHVILLPDGLAAELNSSELQSVIVHELAHTRRRDNLLAAIARVVASIFWFDPVVWWLERRLLCERERACDEMVLAHGASAEDYVAAILKVCRMCFAASAEYAGATGSDLKKRMEQIMSTEVSRITTRSQCASLGALTAIAVLVPLAVGFLKAQTPPKYDGATWSMLRQAEDFMKQGREADAVRMLQAEVEKGRSDLRLVLGNYAVRARRYDLAIREFQRMLDSTDRNSRAAVDIELRLGETYRRKGDFNAAIAALQQAVAVDPKNAVALRTLALVLDNAGRRQDAERAYRDSLKIEPNDGVALNNLAYLLTQSGQNVAEALEYAQRAMKVMPNTSETADTLGWVYLSQHQVAKALPIFNEVVTRQPENATYRYHLGLALARNGNTFAARQAFERALDSKPSPELAQSIQKSMAQLPH